MARKRYISSDVSTDKKLNRMGMHYGDNRLEIDHIHPLARGGTNKLDNLQVLCRSCNARKWANEEENDA